MHPHPRRLRPRVTAACGRSSSVRFACNGQKTARSGYINLQGVFAYKCSIFLFFIRLDLEQRVKLGEEIIRHTIPQTACTRTAVRVCTHRKRSKPLVLRTTQLPVAVSVLEMGFVFPPSSRWTAAICQRRRVAAAQSVLSALLSVVANFWESWGAKAVRDRATGSLRAHHSDVVGHSRRSPRSRNPLIGVLRGK